MSIVVNLINLPRFGRSHCTEQELDDFSLKLKQELELE